MPSPVILNFEPGQSLLSTTEIAFVAGAAWGECLLPFRELDFSTTRHRFDGRSNEWIYNNWYSNVVSQFRQEMHGRLRQVRKSVGGGIIGIEPGGIFKGITQAAAQSFLRRGVNQLIERGGFSLDSLQSSTSTDCLLRGMNGYDTFQMDFNWFNESINMVLIQAGVGCLVSSALNVIFVGHFRWERRFRDPSIETLAYLQRVFANAMAYGFVGDAAVGLILPGISVKIISTF